MTLYEDGTFYIADASLEHGELLAGKYHIEGNQLLFTPKDEAQLTNDFTLTEDTLVLTYEGYTSTLKRVVAD